MSSSSRDLSFLPPCLRSPSVSSLTFVPSQFPHRRSLYSPDPALPDYYTPPNFLHFLGSYAVEASKESISLLSLFLHSSSVVQRISLLLVHFLVFTHLTGEANQETRESLHIQENKWNSLQSLITPFTHSLSSIICLLIISLVLQFCSTRRSSFRLLTSLSFLSLLYLFSPVLSHLTPSYSTDTIYSLSLFFYFIHLITFDYRLDSKETSQPTFSTSSYNAHNTLSLNSSLFCSILLASRIHSHMRVFHFLYFSFVLFGYQPLLQRRLFVIGSFRLHFLCTCLYAGIALYSMSHYTPMPFVLLLTVLFLSMQLLIPLIYVSLHRRKLRWRGGWDYEDENEVTTQNL
jgi:hypothetical protein